MLEAVSLLSPGRGLRKAKTQSLQNNHITSPWAIASLINQSNIVHKIGTGRDPSGVKRIIRINSDMAKSQAALADYMACVWVTPQMDGIFLGSAGDRRRFLDRMIYAFDPAHAGRVTRYENVMRQRSKVLQDNPDPQWLNALETQMAETGVAIAVSRTEFIEHLQLACDTFQTPHFPHAKLNLRGTLETDILNKPALDIEDEFKQRLHGSRNKDAVTGGAYHGPHKSDMDVIYAAKSMPAADCSTGEQKALLLGIVLAHTMMMKNRRGRPPVLLLDEVAAHLDENRRAALFDILENTSAQIWLTGTDRALFSSIENRARFIHIEK